MPSKNERLQILGALYRSFHDCRPQMGSRLKEMRRRFESSDGGEEAVVDMIDGLIALRSHDELRSLADAKAMLNLLTEAHSAIAGKTDGTAFWQSSLAVDGLM